MAIRRWEVAAGALFTAVGAFLVAGGAYAAGVVTLSLVVLVLAVRARVLNDPDLAGGYAGRRAKLETIQTAALGVILVVVLVTMAVALVAQWSEDRQGQIAIYALAGVEVLLLRELDRRSESALRWRKGGRAESQVGVELEPLRAEGWLVLHDVLRDNAQNVDHIVCGASGAFAIETKSRGYVRRSDISQTRGHAAWLREKLNQGWVTGVLCIDGDSSPHERDLVWIVPRSQLRDWLRKQRPRRQVDLIAAQRSLDLSG
jgi:hypothetical protein